MQMDHPSNPRPVGVSHRDYGRFGHFFTATVRKGKPADFHFRTMVLDMDRHGAPTQGAALALYEDYAAAKPGSALSGRMPGFRA